MEPRLTRIAKKRDNQITDFMRKAAKECIRRCIVDNCGTLIVGVNKGWKQSGAMGTVSNQRFCSIPHAKFRQMLRSLCMKYGIRYVEQEESYTSKASVLDGDCIPTWSAGSTGSHTFSGQRVKRGLYRTKKGILINADINGALTRIRLTLQKMITSAHTLMRIPLLNRSVFYAEDRRRLNSQSIIPYFALMRTRLATGYNRIHT